MKNEIQIKKLSQGSFKTEVDFVAVEEPLEISVTYHDSLGKHKKNISVTMRTPGQDAILAIGFLFTEGIINNGFAIASSQHLDFDENKINVELAEGVVPSLQQAERNFYTTSSCGVCGKSSIEAIKTVSAFINHESTVCLDYKILHELPEVLRLQQITFQSTGGLHAAALFSATGDFISLQEDVGRHNALDKLIGDALGKDLLPLLNCILLLSGRASFELVQKAAMAGIKIIAAIGAPSSLAVQLAKEANITLVGFLKRDSFNIYTHQQSINK